MLEIRWQQTATVIAHEKLNDIKNPDVDLNIFQPETVDPPKGWEPVTVTQWGKWHVISFNANKSGSIIVVWRRCIQQKGRSKSE